MVNKWFVIVLIVSAAFNSSSAGPFKKWIQRILKNKDPNTKIIGGETDFPIIVEHTASKGYHKAKIRIEKFQQYGSSDFEYIFTILPDKELLSKEIKKVELLYTENRRILRRLDSHDHQNKAECIKITQTLESKLNYLRDPHNPQKPATASFTVKDATEEGDIGWIGPPEFIGITNLPGRGIGSIVINIILNLFEEMGVKAITLTDASGLYYHGEYWDKDQRYSLKLFRTFQRYNQPDRTPSWYGNFGFNFDDRYTNEEKKKRIKVAIESIDKWTMQNFQEGGTFLDFVSKLGIEYKDDQRLGDIMVQIKKKGDDEYKEAIGILTLDGILHEYMRQIDESYRMKRDSESGSSSCSIQ